MRVNGVRKARERRAVSGSCVSGAMMLAPCTERTRRACCSVRPCGPVPSSSMTLAALSAPMRAISGSRSEVRAAAACALVLWRACAPTLPSTRRMPRRARACVVRAAGAGEVPMAALARPVVGAFGLSMCFIQIMRHLLDVVPGGSGRVVWLQRRCAHAERRCKACVALRWGSGWEMRREFTFEAHMSRFRHFQAPRVNSR